MGANEWIRHGECNGCGWCCQHITKIQIGVQWHPSIDEAYYKARGVLWVNKDGQKLGVFSGSVHCPCPKHDNYKLRCAIYDTRPGICRDFPVSPDQIEDTPCSYWFTRTKLDGSVDIIAGKGAPCAVDETS